MIVSHLLTIYHAVYDKNNNYPSAMITEDDVLFKFDVNYTKLAENAPEDFNIIQLMISNPARVLGNYKLLKRSFDNNLTSNSIYWRNWVQNDLATSTQAYIINKKNIRSFIDRIITYDAYGTPNINIINPNFQVYCKKETKDGKCFLPFPITADFYLYLSARPTYELMVPICNGANVNSTIHPEHFVNHYYSFIGIQQVINQFYRRIELLHSYIKPYDVYWKVRKNVDRLIGMYNNI